MEITIAGVGIGGIFVSPHRHRKLDEALVRRLAASMREVGLINPITLASFGNGAGYNLIAGRHRFEAAKLNGWDSITANILTGLDALAAEKLELRENLDRGELSTAEQAIHYARLKEIAEEEHRLSPGGKEGNQNAKRDKNDSPHCEGNRLSDKKDSTSAGAVARETGRSAKSIDRDSSWVSHINNIDDVVGTSLDSARELEALARMPKAEQEELIARAAAGEKVSAKTELKKLARADKERDLAAKQQALPDKKYGVIYADPEWSFETFSENGMDRSADNHYPTSSTDEIMERGVPGISADDCVLFLWATAPMIGDAMAVLRAWGFEYKSQMVWVKDRIGTGYWFRNQHEILLVGTRGAIPAPAMGTQWPSVLNAPVGRHSEKPAKVYELIEDYYPTLPKIELNARASRDGWDAWGLEAPLLS